MSIWTEAELEFLHLHLSKPTVREIFDAFIEEFGGQRTYDSVQKKVQQLRIAYAPGDVDTTETVSPEVTVLIPYGDEVVSVPHDTKSNLRHERKTWLEDFVAFAKDHKPGDVSIPPVESKGTSLVMALSDLHFGQQNKGFDLEIAKKRIAELPQRLATATAGIAIDEVVVLMMGDMVEGEDIYPSQAHHIVCSAMEQVEVAAESLWAMVKRLQATFKCPIRVVCCPGNHGRTGYSTHEKSNWDNMLYHALKIVAKEHGDKQIGIDCDYSEFKTFQVKDKRGMIYHHGVKHNGTPAMREKIAGWVYAKKFDFMCSGHWHEWKVGCWAEALWMANGSLCGPNDLSERIAQEGPARQGYFLVTPGRPLWGFSYIEWKNDEVSSDSKELK